MHIYGVAISPYVQRALMAARIKGHEIPLKALPGGGFRSPEFAAISPMRRVPVLEDGTFRLCESAAIVGYLDEVLEGPSLLPAHPRERAHARQIVSMAECEVAAGGRDLMSVTVLRAIDAPARAVSGSAQIEKGLGAIERARDPGHAFAAGNAIGIADCLLVPLFTVMTLIDPLAGTSALIAARPGLAAYHARMRDDPVASRTIREMGEGFGAFVASARARARARA